MNIATLRNIIDEIEFRGEYAPKSYDDAELILQPITVENIYSKDKLLSNYMLKMKMCDRSINTNREDLANWTEGKALNRFPLACSIVDKLTRAEKTVKLLSQVCSMLEQQIDAFTEEHYDEFMLLFSR
jgi:hypothetical protein